MSNANQSFSGRHRGTLSRRTALKLAGAATVAATTRALPTPGVAAQSLSGGITVSFEGTDTTLAGAVDQAVQALTAANAGIEIEVKQGAGGNFATQLALALSTNRGPDVFALNGLGIGELSAAGFLESLTPRMETWEGWAQIPESVRTAILYQDQVWALPYSLDTHFLYYRKDLFEQAGLPRDWQPATPDDILAAARQVKSALPDVIPYAIYAGANGANSTPIRGFLPLLYAYGGSMTDESGLWIIDSCAIRQTLSYYQTAYQTDETVPQQTMTAADPAATMREAFGKGELVILFDGSWTYDNWLRDNPEDTQQNIGYVLHPAADGRPAFTVGGVGTCWYINAQSPNKELAWAFVAAMLTKEMQVALNLADLHVPARADAAADSAFAADPFLAAMVGTVPVMEIGPPDPAYRKLIGIVQNATGIVASGEVSADEAVQRYAEELTSVLGPDKVVAQLCA